MNRSRTSLALVILFVAATTSACSTLFDVRSFGRIGDAVTFTFYETRADVKPKKMRIYRLDVRRRDGANKWTPVWAVSGPPRIDRIVYGAALEGMTTTVGPLRLEPGRTYEIFAAGLPSHWSPIGYASDCFQIATDGSVIQTTCVPRQGLD